VENDNRTVGDWACAGLACRLKAKYFSGKAAGLLRRRQ